MIGAMEGCLLAADFETGFSAVLRAFLKEKNRITLYLPIDYRKGFAQSLTVPEGVKTVVYPICGTGEPDWKEIKQSEEGAPDIFVYVHPPKGGEIGRAREYCSNVDAVLLEDCSELLSPNENVGKKGDIVVLDPSRWGIIKKGLVIKICFDRPGFAVALEEDRKMSPADRDKLLKYDEVQWKELYYSLQLQSEAWEYLWPDEESRKEKLYVGNNLNRMYRKYGKRRLIEQEPDAVTTDWTGVTEETWYDIMRRVGQSTLTQDWSYGGVKASEEGWKVERALIRCGGKVVGGVQVLVKYHAVVRGNRGPLLLPEYRTPENVLSVIRQVKKRFGFKVYFWQTDLVNTPVVWNHLVNHSWYLYGRQGARSAWVDLRVSEESLRKGLKSKWRNQMTSAEKSGMQFAEWKDHFTEVISLYEENMRRKQFQGIPVTLLKALFQQKNCPLVAYSVRNREGELLAFDVVYIHGCAATYLIGWNSEEGRKQNANNMLLFRAMLDLKNKGIEWFDLGGIDEIHTPQIAKFKRGIGAAEYELVPEGVSL